MVVGENTNNGVKKVYLLVSHLKKMIPILLTWIYILFLAIPYGVFTITFLKNLLKLESNAGPASPVLITLLGLVAINTLTCYLSLFLKIGLLANALVLVVGLLLLARYWNAVKQVGKDFTDWIRTLHRVSLALLIALGLLAWTSSVGEPNHYDDGLYYLPYINWVSQYPVVPGLGNLHGRLAFNSNWHLLNALFSFNFIKGVYFHQLNCLLFALMSLYIIESIDAVVRHRFGPSDLLKSSWIVFTYPLIVNIASPAPDVPVTYLSWIVLFLFFNLLQLKENSDKSLFLPFIFVFSAYLITLKLSSVIVGLVPLFLFTRMFVRGNAAAAVKSALVMGIILLPWLIRNVYLSGYVVYPFAALDILKVAWKMPYESVQAEADWVAAFAKAIPVEAANHTPLSGWIGPWWESLVTSEKMIVLVSGTGLLVLIVLAAFGQKLPRRSLPLLWILAAGLLFWFVKAPALRFGYGFIFFTFGTVIAFLIVCLQPRFRYATLVFLIIICLPAQWPAFKGFGAIKGQVFTFRPYPDVAVQSTRSTCSGLELFYPASGNQCFGAPLPCTPYYRTNLKLRTGSLADGFEMCR